uniref:dual specificity protein phosphatase 22-like n=1 Tax=Myxine glutinosa TaxID=7769 RepID=UPI00358FD02D
MADSSRYTSLEALTRKHGIVCSPPSGIDVEAIILAVREIIGLDNVKAASRMNKRVVIFVSTVPMVAQIVEHGLFFAPDVFVQVLDGLYVGNIRDSTDKEALQANNITHVLSIHDTAREALEGITYLCIQAVDTPYQNITQHFKECIHFIHSCRLDGKCCLVHCLAGVSRSVTVVVAYMMTVTELTWEEAMFAVKAVRSCANPNLGFQHQLQIFQVTDLTEMRKWLRREFKESPYEDEKTARQLMLCYMDQKRQEERLILGQQDSV